MLSASGCLAKGRCQAIFSSLLVLLLANAAFAALKNPLDDVHNATPTATILIDTATYGQGTGAGGNVLSNTWYASTTKNGAGGYLLEYNGQTFDRAISLGMALTGVDVCPDGSIVVSSGTSLYKGTISAGAWQEHGRIDIGKTINDVCYGYGMADYFVATSEGVYAVRNGGLGEKVDGSEVKAIKYFKLDASQYSPDGLSFLQGNGANTVSDTGLTITGFTNTLNNYTYPDGDVQAKDFRALVEGGVGSTVSVIQFYANDTYVSGIIVPEPATLSLLALGGMAILRRKRK
ncbi:MAG: PEP-CTERM sorting domain-containing protein [Planctomycetota bacterium]